MVATFVARNGGIGSTGSNGNSAVKVVGNLHRVWRGGEGGYHEPEISGDDRDSDDDYDYEEEEEEDYDDESVIRGDEYDMETEDEELTVRGFRCAQRNCIPLLWREFAKFFS